MKLWSSFYPDVLVHVPGCPDPVVDHALSRSAREFFNRTRIWVEWLSAVAATDGTGLSYVFSTPVESDILRIEKATINGSPLKVSGYRQMDSDWTIHHQQEQALISSDLSNFVLDGYFAGGDSVQVQVSLTPSIAATGIPDYLANRHMDAIAEGAKSMLLMTQGTSYFNPGLSKVASDKFDAAIDREAVNAFRSHTNVMPRAKIKWC